MGGCRSVACRGHCTHRLGRGEGGRGEGGIRQEGGLAGLAGWGAGRQVGGQAGGQAGGAGRQAGRQAGEQAWCAKPKPGASHLRLRCREP